MISLVLYGRNDSYGYNLHKRAAISLNCMAEVLTDPQDEIIFVDYNTPDDFPTFPEAIQDTLTEKARSILRILRVRPTHHERFREKTHLVCLEPVARNVAIRRSNPNNRWILSTNTDMVFVPRRGKSLSEIAAKLPDAYYHLPRFEVPETLWESADRLNPLATIASFETWGRDLHLNEIVYAYHPDVRYDGPGDFQLILRSDLWRIHGFDEGMLLGWHVDSNIARRLALLPRPIGDVLDEVFGYHCDHTRQVTAAHKARGAQNDQKIFFENVTRAPVPEQARTWGLADETIEELKTNTTSSNYVAALRSAIRQPLLEPTKIGYSSESFNRLDYSSEHVIPFLADSLTSYPRDTVLAWFGAKKTSLQHFARFWSEMGFRQPILVFAAAQWLGEIPGHCVWAPKDDACDRAQVFVFDWGKPETGSPDAWIFEKDPIIQEVSRGFRGAVRHERLRLQSDSAHPRRFIGINTINNAVEGVFNNSIGAALTPLATHIRQGFLDTHAGANDILASLHAGKAGQKLPEGIVALPEIDGYVFYGPFLDLDKGTYEFSLHFADVRFNSEDPLVLGLEIVSNGRLLAFREITRDDLKIGFAQLAFSVWSELSDSPIWPRVEFRLRTPGTVGITIRRAVLEEVTVGTDAPEPGGSLDYAPMLSVGSAGKRDGRAIRVLTGANGVAFHGPYFTVPAGRYRLALTFSEIGSTFPSAATGLTITAASEARILAYQEISREELMAGVCSFEFDIPSNADGNGLEFVLRTTGNTKAVVSSAVMDRISDAAHEHDRYDFNFLNLLYLGPQSRWRSAPDSSGRLAIHSGLGSSGVLAYGPYMSLEPGNYEVVFRMLVGRGVPGASIKVDVAGNLGRQILAEGRVIPNGDGPLARVLGLKWTPAEVRLNFTVSDQPAADDNGLFEFRTWSSRKLDLFLTSVRLQRIFSLVAPPIAPEAAPVSQ